LEITTKNVKKMSQPPMDKTLYPKSLGRKKPDDWSPRPAIPQPSNTINGNITTINMSMLSTGTIANSQIEAKRSVALNAAFRYFMKANLI
jgi:hypothetical protein